MRAAVSVGLAPVHPRLAEDRAQFGRQVAALRQRLEWTQEKLAEACGLDRKTINRIENGRHSPSLDRVLVLAYALGSDPGELFSWD